MGNIALAGGKLAVHIFRIGLTRVAIQNLQEHERDSIRGVSSELQRGYTERVSPELQKQLGKFNIIKGGKQA